MLDQTQLSDLQVKSISNRLEAHSGVSYSSSIDNQDGESVYIFRANDLPSQNGFSIHLRLSRSRVIATLELDDFAGKLIRFIVKNLDETKALWREVVSKQVANGAKIGVEINGEFLVDVRELPIMNWDTLYISWMNNSPMDFRLSAERRFTEVTTAVLQLSDLIGSILPFDDGLIPEPPVNWGGREGQLSTVKHNKYERNRANRTACIAIFGAVCGVCGFDFENRYGEIGEGFIEVHHLLPVSQMGGHYSVSPKTDLIPLCSNCHSMAHTRNPPWSPAELREKIR